MPEIDELIARARPPVTPMEHLLVALERTSHDGGWDSGAVLYLIYHQIAGGADLFRRHTSFGLPVAREGLTAVPAMPPHVLNSGQPMHVVYRWAALLAGAPESVTAKLMVRPMRQPGFVGAVLVSEFWLRLFEDDDDRRAASRTRFADTPGSVECRWAVSVDTDLQCQTVSRVRGRPAGVLAENALLVSGGAIVASLQAIIAAVTQRPLAEYVAKLYANPPAGWTGWA